MVQECEWSDWELSILITQWRTSLSCEEIGRLCGGRSKNAVIAQAGRLELGPKVRARIALPVLKMIASQPLPALESRTTCVSLEFLDDGMCHWAVTDTQGNDGFCGDKCSGKYCDRHKALSVQPKKRAA